MSMKLDQHALREVRAAWLAGCSLGECVSNACPHDPDGNPIMEHYQAISATYGALHAQYGWLLANAGIPRHGD